MIVLPYKEIEEEAARIVHQLRTAGWDETDAMDEADRRINELLEKRSQQGER